MTERKKAADMNERRVECLLQVAGDTVILNTFDKQFRGGGPQWSDRPHGKLPRYSLHGLYPVPVDTQRRGHQKAGRAWCLEFWDTPDDLDGMQAKRLPHERRYRFYTLLDAPKNAIWKASVTFPSLRLRLLLPDVEPGYLSQRIYQGGHWQGSSQPIDEEALTALRNEMGFAA